jgi:5-methylcytosine-specific restriction endonuclease McrA
MSRTLIAKYVNPWKFRREREAERLRALRERDGDACSRCRRPMRFDLPTGHDQLATIEEILPRAAGGSQALDNLCLCHRRCNTAQADLTIEVTERIRRNSEAALLSRSRFRRTG